MFLASFPPILKRWKRGLTWPPSRPEVANSLRKDRIPEDGNIQFPSAWATRKRFRDRGAEKNGIVIRELRTWNNRTGRHKMKPGRREANKVDAGGQGTIGFQPGVSAKIGMEMAPKIQNTELRKSNSSETKLSRTVTAGSEPRRSLVLSKTALKSPHSIVGTDGSAKSRHEVKNSSRSGSG